MTAPVAPSNAHLIIAILETSKGLQPVAYMTEMPGTEDELRGMAILAWRKAVEGESAFHGVDIKPLNWRRLQPGEVSRCIS